MLIEAGGRDVIERVVQILPESAAGVLGISGWVWPGPSFCFPEPIATRREMCYSSLPFKQMLYPSLGEGCLHDEPPLPMDHRAQNHERASRALSEKHYLVPAPPSAVAVQAANLCFSQKTRF